MRDLPFPMVAANKVVPLVLEKAAFRRRVQDVSIDASCGRVLACDVLSENTVPNSPVACLDGIACSFEHLRTRQTSLLQEGLDFEFCNTGCALPAGCDTIVRIEDVCQEGENSYSLLALPDRKGALVAEAGSRLRKGDLVAPRDYRVCAEDVGRFASAGVRKVSVYEPCRVAFIPTGDELVDREIELPIGKNVESNSSVIRALVSQWGGTYLGYPIQPDDSDAIRNVLADAVAQSDIVVLNAGTSKGGKDYSLGAISSIGEVIVHKVDHGPGHHTMAAITDDGVPVLVLVGPPGGMALTARMYLKPLMYAYFKQNIPEPAVVRATLSADLRARFTIDFYHSVCVHSDEGQLVASPVSHDTPWEANAIVKVPRSPDGVTSCKAGCVVDAVLNEGAVIKCAV